MISAKEFRFKVYPSEALERYAMRFLNPASSFA